MSKKDKSLKQVINQMLRGYGYQDQLDEIELIEAYESVVGVMFVKHTTDKFFKNKKLYIKLDSAVLKQELSYMRSTVVLKINEIVGKKIIEEIIIK